MRLSDTNIIVDIHKYNRTNCSYLLRQFLYWFLICIIYLVCFGIIAIEIIYLIKTDVFKNFDSILSASNSRFCAYIPYYVIASIVATFIGFLCTIYHLYKNFK